MGVNRGKQFENQIKKGFEQVEPISIDRMHDQTTGYVGSSNICDFIVYAKPYICYMECKSCYGNTLPFTNITDTQWNGLLQKSKIDGVVAGICVWFIEHDETVFIPIQLLEKSKHAGKKSINVAEIYDKDMYMTYSINIPGKKKRTFVDYDMSKFFYEVECRGLDYL